MMHAVPLQMPPADIAAGARRWYKCGQSAGPAVRAGGEALIGGDGG